MEISDIVLEMELHGVDTDDINEIITLYKKIGFDSEGLDNELIKRGYEKLFTVNYDDYDNWEDDDDYFDVEKFPHKKRFMD